MRFRETHCHCSPFSFDGKRSLEALLREADAKGLAGLCLTDHYDKDSVEGHIVADVSPYGGPAAAGEWIFDPEAYFSALLPLKRERDAAAAPGRGGRAELLIGVELNFEPHQVELGRRLAADYPFDEIIVSCHYMDDTDLYYYPEFFAQSKGEAYRRWLHKLIRIAASDLDFDILGHYDYIARCASYADPVMRYDDFADEFDTLFRLLIARGAALEFNTRARYQAKDEARRRAMAIDPRLVRRYLDLGGELVTLASDSHEEGTLGLLFEEGAATLYACGLRRLCYFKERRPYAIALT